MCAWHGVLKIRDFLSSTQFIDVTFATVHASVLRRPKPLPVQDVRYIANAAGGLLPVLAESLRDTFTKAVILTSYGMTEW